MSEQEKKDYFDNAIKELKEEVTDAKLKINITYFIVLISSLIFAAYIYVTPDTNPKNITPYVSDNVFLISMFGFPIFYSIYILIKVNIQKEPNNE